MDIINVEKIDNGYIVTVLGVPYHPKTFFETAEEAAAFVLGELKVIA